METYKSLDENRSFFESFKLPFRLTHRFQQASTNEKNNHFLLHFLPKYIVTNVTRFTIMDIVLFFSGFKRIIRIGFFVYIFLLLSLTKGEKLQQLNVKIENGPLKSAQTHFDLTIKL